MARKASGTSGPWRVLVGINYPPNDTRAEPGDVIDDLPAVEAAWMRADGIIEPVSSDATPVSEEV